jgi:hypothetical protein
LPGDVDLAGIADYRGPAWRPLHVICSANGAGDGPLFSGDRAIIELDPASVAADIYGQGPVLGCDRAILQLDQTSFAANLYW